MWLDLLTLTVSYKVVAVKYIKVMETFSIALEGLISAESDLWLQTCFPATQQALFFWDF